jgi:hypothetical protein
MASTDDQYSHIDLSITHVIGSAPKFPEFGGKDFADAEVMPTRRCPSKTGAPYRFCKKGLLTARFQDPSMEMSLRCDGFATNQRWC